MRTGTRVARRFVRRSAGVVRAAGGWVTDRFPKSRVLKFAAAAQIVLFAALAAALRQQQLALAITLVVLLAMPMALFAPAKRGILLELVPAKKLSRAVGWMEMFSVSALLLGAYFGGRMFDHWAVVKGGPWQGAFWTAMVLVGPR